MGAASDLVNAACDIEAQIMDRFGMVDRIQLSKAALTLIRPITKDGAVSYEIPLCWKGIDGRECAIEVVDSDDVTAAFVTTKGEVVPIVTSYP